MKFGYGSPSDEIWLGFLNTEFIVNVNRRKKKSYIISGMKLNLNEWYLIAFVFNRTKDYIYVNQKMTSKRKYMNAPFDATRTDHFIGEKVWRNDSKWSVTIDEIKLYKGVLTSNQILNEYSLTEELTIDPKQTIITTRNELIYALCFCLLVLLLLSILVVGMF